MSRIGKIEGNSIDTHSTWRILGADGTLYSNYKLCRTIILFAHLLEDEWFCVVLVYIISHCCCRPKKKQLIECKACRLPGTVIKFVRQLVFLEIMFLNITGIMVSKIAILFSSINGLYFHTQQIWTSKFGTSFLHWFCPPPKLLFTNIEHHYCQQQ